MRVLFTTQVFPPETHPTAIMVDELSHALAVAGHEVAVAAGFPHHPHGRLIGGYAKALFASEWRETIEVRRGWHLTSANMSLPVRAAVMLTQAFGTTAVAIGWKAPDVVVNFGPPLIGPSLSALVAKLRGARFVPVIYDLYPDVAIETGAIRNRIAVWAARIVERFVYRQADRIVVLSEGFRRSLLGRGVSERKIEIVPVWLDPREIAPSEHRNAWRREMGIGPDIRVILYAGTIGLVSGAEIVVNAAESLRDRPDVRFLFVGEGRVKDDVERVTRCRGLDNVRFVPFQPRERLNEVQATSDISLVTLAPGRGLTSVPSKVVGYMAAGRPIVASVDEDSDTACAVREGACGVVTRPGNPLALAAAIRELLDDPARRETMGRRARSYFERTYSRDAALAKMTGILEASVRGSSESRCDPAT